MNKLLYTLDADGDCIEINAIIEFASRQELDNIGALLSHGAGMDWRVAGWRRGSFGDCWMRLPRSPAVDVDGVANIGGIRCSVKNPGEHKGSKIAWWLTPLDEVLVPIWEPKQQQQGNHSV